MKHLYRIALTILCCGLLTPCFLAGCGKESDTGYGGDVKSAPGDRLPPTRRQAGG